MKKIFISLAAMLCLASTVSAQTLIVVEEKPVLTNKKGVRILPQAGEMSIGVSATPFFNYFGNMFTRDGSNTAPTFMSNGAGLNFKFFTTDNQAIRAGINVNFGNNYYYGYPTSNTTPGLTVTDQMRTSNQLFGINIGYEWRRGMGRLQGYCGGQLSASYSRMTTKYTYGNAMTTAHNNPWTWDFKNETQSEVTSRVLETAGATNISVGVNGFVGVEYFFAPKMSIGGELGLGIYYMNQGDSEYKTENWNSTSNTIDIKTEKRNDPSMPTDGLSIRTGTQGNIFFNFYF